MKNAIDHLIHHCLSNGAVLSVFDGEEWAVKKSRDSSEIKAAVDSVDEAHIHIYMGPQDEKVGMAWVSESVDLEGDEKVMDHTDNAFMNDWWACYEAENETERDAPRP